MSQHGCPERLSSRSKGFAEEGGSQATMELLVETLTGTAFEMTVSPSDTIFAIKSKIYRVEGIPVSAQHLVLGSRELADGASLSAAGVRPGARLRLVLALRGGPQASRRRPPPAHLDTLLHADRDDVEWAVGGSGCKVTVVVFREGERVNLLRLAAPEPTGHAHEPPRPTRPLTNAKYSSSLPALGGPDTGEVVPGSGLFSSAAVNAVTAGKMLDLRQRMQRLCLHRAPTESGSELTKTRSEETLPRRDLDLPFRVYEEVPPTLAGSWCSLSASAPTLSPPTPTPTAAPMPTRPRPHPPLARCHRTELAPTTTQEQRLPPCLPVPPSDPPAPLAPLLTEQPPGRPPRPRCALCRRRLGAATTHTCRCGGDYCAPHRYAEVHGCLYDYKAGAAARLRRENPLVAAPKLPKI